MYRVIWELKSGYQGKTDWDENLGFVCAQLATIAMLDLRDGFNWIQIESKEYYDS